MLKPVWRNKFDVSSI